MCFLGRFSSLGHIGSSLDSLDPFVDLSVSVLIDCFSGRLRSTKKMEAGREAAREVASADSQGPMDVDTEVKDELPEEPWDRTAAPCFPHLSSQQEPAKMLRTNLGPDGADSAARPPD